MSRRQRPWSKTHDREIAAVYGEGSYPENGKIRKGVGI